MAQFVDPFSLFPAQAGVILLERNDKIVYNPFPRASGGDPTHSSLSYGKAFFSPRKRG